MLTSIKVLGVDSDKNNAHLEAVLALGNVDAHSLTTPAPHSSDSVVSCLLYIRIDVLKSTSFLPFAYTLKRVPCESASQPRQCILDLSILPFRQQ